MMMALQPTFKSTSKNYKYFYRGQYVAPDADDIIQAIKQRKVRLQPYENALKNFKYREALNATLN